MKESHVKNYHAHLYFEKDQVDLAHEVLEKVKSRFDFDIGRVWDKPVGPHPIGSCQITVPTSELNGFIPFMAEARGDLDVFLHANTGDDLLDHTQLVMWMGKSYRLNIEMFEKSAN